MADWQARLLRVRAQRLDPQFAPVGDGPAEVVRAVVGVQAQDARAGSLAVRARSRGLTAAAVDRAREERELVRTRLMRGTLHLVAAFDVGWLLALLGPVFDRPSRRRQELGLDEATCARAVDVICEALGRDGPLTRAELSGELAGQGLPAAGQATIHLLGHAGLRGYICQGPDRAGEPTYVLLDDWIPAGPSLSAEEAGVELARRYLAGYAPAGPADFAAWAGLLMGQARAAWAGLANELIPVEVAGRAAWLPEARAAWLDEPQPAPSVRLLPAFDTYLLGYESRDLALAPEHARRIHPGGGILHPALLIDGRVAGTWRMRRRQTRLDVEVEPFAPLPAPVTDALAGEAEDVGHFLGEQAALVLRPVLSA